MSTPTIRHALQEARTCIQIDRTAFADCAVDSDNTMAPEDVEVVAEYDRVLQLIDQALEELA